jgi:hypothetical protein
MNGVLPFDHEYSEKEVAKKIINDEIKSNSYFKSCSSEGKKFIEGI